MKIYVLGSEDEVAGFSLVGVDTVSVSDEGDFIKSCREVINSKDAGIVVITDRFFDLFEKNFSDKLKKRAVPAVVFIPSFDGIHHKESIKEFVANVIGIRL